MTKKVSNVPNPDELVIELCHVETPEDLFPGIFLKEAATYRPAITARATFVKGAYCRDQMRKSSIVSLLGERSQPSSWQRASNSAWRRLSGLCSAQNSLITAYVSRKCSRQAAPGSLRMWGRRTSFRNLAKNMFEVTKYFPRRCPIFAFSAIGMRLSMIMRSRPVKKGVTSCLGAVELTNTLRSP